MLGWIPWCQEKQQPSSDDSSIDQTSSSPVVSHGDSSTPPKVIAVRGSRPVWVLFVQDIVTNVMGACLSGGGATQIIELADGDEAAFHDRFIEDRVLGEGEFGVVKLVHDMKESKARGTDTAPNALACKTLRKGVVFKDNTLFAPLKPEILQGEVNMLRSLGGAHFCLLLIGVYETPRAILMVTEYCAGGEMMEYVSKQEEDLRTDDVSRVSFQMLDAVNHCAKHGIIHRDIKPENVMFQYPTPGSDLRLIDFGSGTNKPTLVEGQNHTTFAGSAFYISPEMFQRTYTQKTDVWSVGVALYVLVAGYPAEVLQRAFNLLQSANRDLKQLPNMPPNMPESYYDMLEGLLVYRHKNRKSAGEMLTHEFVQFHQMAFTIDQISMEAQVEANGQALKDTTGIGNRKRTQSFSLKGSVGRHSLFMDYQKFERSLTALLATLLDRKELVALLDALQEKMNANESKPEQKPVDNKDETTTTTKQAQMAPHEKTLDVIPIRELKTILEAQKQDQVLAMITKLPGSASYNGFAYQASLLKEFVQDEPTDGGKGGNNSTRGPAKGGKRFRTNSLRGSFRSGGLLNFSAGPGRKTLDGSIHSQGSLRGNRNTSTHSNSKAANTNVNASVSGGGVYQEWKKKGGLVNPRKGKAPAGSSHMSSPDLKRNVSQ